MIRNGSMSDLKKICKLSFINPPNEKERRSYYSDIAKLNGCKNQNCLDCTKECKERNGIC